MRVLISPTSSRKTVPFGAISSEPGLVAVRAGEAAAHVAEELRLEQRVGQAGAVERDERRGRARAAVVNQTRDDFLADAGLAGDQHLGVGARGAVDVGFDACESLRCGR